ncbi:AzlD family protein [Afifella sp. IM 167]|uniref:AzlD family protein n=1 Tax=Afifella sp. IM 167 TaxID=2033586 RepID=UPI001CCA61FB|nr:AzlD domain-containing protein [Afifella sp. IM 167]MBZ8135204.1 branched-chain amino acid transport [Afifella sp. IM 167]
MSGEWQPLLLILACGLVTYATRIGGDVILSRFGRLSPRVEAALDAVPAAVMTTLIVPMALATGAAETLAAILTILASLRFSMPVTLIVGVGSLFVLRALLGS